MKIQNPNVPGLGLSGLGMTAGIEQGVRESKRAEHVGSPVDQVSLSDLSTALSAAQSHSPERSAYLERLSASVQTGRYEVNAAAVSRSIIEDATGSGYKE